MTKTICCGCDKEIEVDEEIADCKNNRCADCREEIKQWDRQEREAHPDDID